MEAHAIPADARTLHGHFSRDLAPVLTIEPGDRVRFATLDAGWGAPDQADPFAAPRPFEPRDRTLERGHALTGPVAVRGARPGATLVVHIEEVRPGSWGWTSAGGFPSPLNQRLGVADGPQVALRWALDPDAGLARDRSGRTLEIRPFMGVMGMPPVAPGDHSTIPPRRTGGNIDCRELVAGSTLYLPIEMEGALFSTGDGHALQGDGEVAGPALECPMERVVLGFDLEERALAMPRARTPAGWITLRVRRGSRRGHAPGARRHARPHDRALRPAAQGGAGARQPHGESPDHPDRQRGPRGARPAAGRRGGARLTASRVPASFLR